MMQPSEFERIIKIDRLPSEPATLTADEGERTALADRFGLAAIKSLEAVIELTPDGDAILASGKLLADIEQFCAVTHEPFPVRLEEEIKLRFSQGPQGTADEDDEIELAEEELDIIHYEGRSFDLGEAIAQSLGLAIDPYAEGPDADAARKNAGIISDEDQPTAGPLADALAALKKD